MKGVRFVSGFMAGIMRPFKTKKKKENSLVFWTSRLQVLLRHAREFSNIRLRRANIKSHLTRKVDPILKLGNYNATACITNFSAQQTQRSTPFSIARTWKFARVLYVRREAWRPLFFSFFRRIYLAQAGLISQIIFTDQKSCEKNKKHKQIPVRSGLC